MKPRSTKRAKFKLRKSQIRRIGNLEVLKEPNSNFVQLLLAVTGLALSHQAEWETANWMVSSGWMRNSQSGWSCLSGWMRNSWLRRNSCSLCSQSGWSCLIRLNEKQPIRMKLPHQAGWETADLGEIAVLCALNQDEAVSSGWMRNSQSGWSCLIRLDEKETADLGEIGVLCTLNQDEAVSSGWMRNSQ